MNLKISKQKPRHYKKRAFISTPVSTNCIEINVPLPMALISPMDTFSIIMKKFICRQGYIITSALKQMQLICKKMTTSYKQMPFKVFLWV